MLANNCLFDLTYAIRNKRDYKQALSFVEKASRFAEIIDSPNLNNSGVYKKLIDVFVESLVSHVKALGVYESINIYHNKSYGSDGVSKAYEASNRHRLAIEDDQLSVLNGLPLKWMNDIVRGAIRYGILFKIQRIFTF